VEIEGKAAHVTGAGAGIGRAIAMRLAAEGAWVAVSDIDEEGGRETAARIEADGGRAAFVRADVSREDDVRALVAFTEETFDGLDILVNNAGGAPEPHFPDAATTHWLHQVAANLFGVMLGTHFGIAAMRRGSGGAIVNISSRAGIGFAPYGAPEYAASKAAIWRFSAAVGSLAREGIRVNCICPDWVEIEKIRARRLELGEEDWAKVGPVSLVPPEDIAEVATLLVRSEGLAGRVALCPHDGDWGLVPLDDMPAVELLPGLER
jgi:NAD(P)-dependent dehydrogenase (short-subunit alcohol dehydrogenase family)